MNRVFSSTDEVGQYLVNENIKKDDEANKFNNDNPLLLAHPFIIHFT